MSELTRTLKIEGMSCPNCVRHVKNALDGLDGVSAEVDLTTGSAILRMASMIDDETLKKAVTDAGYTVTSID